MADSDNDLPDLVESSDDDTRPLELRKQTAEHAECWLKRADRFLEKQDIWNRIFCLCPFLFGVNNVLPAAWMKALKLAELLLNNERQYNLTYIEWKEWECIDLMDLIISVVQKRMRNRDVLSCTLDMVRSLDDCKTGVIIDVDLVIKEAGKFSEISDIWREVLKDDLSHGKEKAAKFGVLYCIRLYLQHVLSITEGRCDFVDETRSVLRPKGAAKQAEEYKKEGNTVYAEGKYHQSVKLYTQAAEKDRLNHIYFGNRAQAYNKLKLYKEALADGRRAVTIKPDFSKGHYRYSQAFYCLGQLDAAIRVNKAGLSLCQKSISNDYTNVKELEQQGKSFTHERDENQLNKHLTAIPKDLEEKLNRLPGSNSAEDLSDKWGFKVEKMEKPRHLSYCTDDVPPMVSSDSDSDSPPVKRRDRDNRPNNFINKTIKRKEDKTFEQNLADMFKPPLKSPKESISEPDVTSPNTNNSGNANSFNDNANVNNNARRRPKGAPEGVIPTMRAAPAPATAPLSAKALKEAKKAKKLQDKHGLQSYMAEGSDSLMNSVSKTAMTSYHKALDIVSHSDMESLGLDEPDLVTLKYAFGIAAVMTGIFKSILEGIETFEDIIKTHQDIRFPLAYFGLGKAYITLNRYGDAVSPLNDGYTITKNVRFATVPWPGSKTIIPESHQNVLLECFREAIDMCKFPPAPDAVCRYHSDESEERTVIYLTDPDFKGVIKIICEMKCVIAFHQTCWRNYKSQHNKVNDKDILDTVCPTPDCSGLVIEINIMRPDSLTKEHKSEKHSAHNDVKPKRPLLKLKTTNNEKLARRLERKELRKQRRQEHLEEQDDLMDDIHDILQDSSDSITLNPDVNHAGASGTGKLHPLPDIKETTVLKKEDIKLPKLENYRSRKLKKKRDKGRHVISLPVNFADRQDEAVIGDSVNEDDIKLTTPVTPTKLLPVPQNHQQDVAKKPLIAREKQHFPMDDITENLFSYFDDLLKASGPVVIDDPKIQQEMEVFPLEAQEKIKQIGGLGEFLRQSLKFAVIDDIISLMSEAVKAREMALARRNERNLRGNVDVHDAWKTVGKGFNVDSLSASIPEVSPPKSSEFLSNKQKTDAFLHSRKLDGVSGGGDNATVGGNKFVVNSNSNAESTSVPNATPVNMSDRPSATRVGLDTFDQFFSSAIMIEVESPGIDTLDSIDDFPALSRDGKNKTKHYDDLDDFEIVSDPGSEFFSDHKETGGAVKMRADLKPKPLYDPTAPRSEPSVSRSSSHSDVSERSSVSSEMVPKPLKPLKGFGVGLQTQLWDKSGSEDLWAQVKREDFEGSERGTDSPRSDLGMESARRAAEEFIYKTDEKFVSELADSVVEKIYSGKTVPEAEKLETLRRVSADIWKDFERSAASGKLGAARFLDNNSGDVEYSKTVGTFASDFMKRHYLNEDGVHFPTASNVNVVYPQTSPLVNPAFSQPSPPAVLSPDPSIISSTAWTSDTTSDTGTTFNTNISNIYQGPRMTSGYNLFAGPSYGFGGTVLPKTQPPPPPQAFVRPPLSARSFYNGAMSPNSNTSPTGLPFKLPMRMPFSPMSPVLVDKFDKETQVINECKTVETMTDPYEPYKEELLRVKHERDGYMKIHNEGKAYCEKITQNFVEKENQYKHREVELSSKYCSLEQEKRSWLCERESLQEEMGHLQRDLAVRDLREQEFKDKMVTQEHKVNEIAKLATEQRDKDLTEIKKFMSVSERYRQERDESQRRAQSAEVEILRTKEQSAVHRLERSLKEATYHSQHLAGFIKKHGEEKKGVPAALQQMSDHWKQVTDNCAAALRELKSQFESQRTEISNGKLLSDLPLVPVPSPPPIPEAIKQFMGNAHTMGKMMPRLPSPYATHPNPGAISPTMPHPFPSPIALQMLRAAPSPTALPIPRPGLAPVPTGMGQRPLVMPARPHLPAHKQPMTSFEKLMLKLQSLFPNYESSDFKKYIQELRQNRGGSLSGMTIEDITSQIADIIHRQQKQQETASTQAASNLTNKKQMAAPPGLSSSWAFSSPDRKPTPGTELGADYFQEEEDPCVICHEEMASAATTTLECGHKFHDECIRKWFKEQSTCPNCRVHALLSDDFPTLG